LNVLHNNASDASANALDMDIVDLDMELFDRLIAVNSRLMSWAASMRSAHARAWGRLDRLHRVDRGDRRSWRANRLRRPQKPGRAVDQIGGGAVRVAGHTVQRRCTGLVLTPALRNSYTSPEQIEATLEIYPMPRLCEPRTLPMRCCS